MGRLRECLAKAVLPGKPTNFVFLTEVIVYNNSIFKSCEAQGTSNNPASNMSVLELHPISEACITTTSPHSIRQSIVHAMFDCQLDAALYKQLSHGIDIYFDDWYEEQCRQCARQVSVITQAELLRTVAYLRDPNETRVSILQKLLDSQPPNQAATISDVEASITLAARLLLMISIDDFRLTVTIGQPIAWPDGPIQAVIDAEFAPSVGPFDTIRLPKVFNALNLEKIAGIKVYWTSNLADHLLMNDDEGTVTLFHNMTFLDLHKRSSCHLLSDSLISETISTLALLLPCNSPAVTKYFAQCQARWSLDPAAGRCGHLSARMRKIESFKHWRDRLTILKQAFDDSEPHTILQWWHDDRKRVQWYTFWVAALVLLITVVLGTVQCVAAVIQAWASVKMLN